MMYFLELPDGAIQSFPFRLLDGWTALEIIKYLYQMAYPVREPNYRDDDMLTLFLDGELIRNVSMSKYKEWANSLIQKKESFK